MTDYHNFCTKDTTKEQRDKWNVGDIWDNSIECLLCGDKLRSRNRHDFRECKCGNSYVDGGSCYPRWGGKDISKIVKITEYFSDVQRLMNE